MTVLEVDLSFLCLRHPYLVHDCIPIRVDVVRYQLCQVDERTKRRRGNIRLSDRAPILIRPQRRKVIEQRSVNAALNYPKDKLRIVVYQRRLHRFDKRDHWKIAKRDTRVELFDIRKEKGAKESRALWIGCETRNIGCDCHLRRDTLRTRIPCGIWSPSFCCTKSLAE